MSTSEQLDYTIAPLDLKVLFMHTRFAYNKGKMTFEDWTKEVKEGYAEYHQRNTDKPEIYGEPKTFSQWVNAQIIMITS